MTGFAKPWFLYCESCEILFILSIWSLGAGRNFPGNHLRRRGDAPANGVVTRDRVRSVSAGERGEGRGGRVQGDLDLFIVMHDGDESGLEG